VFAKLGRAFPRTRGPYAYARRALGDFVGFQMAWGYWIAVWAGNAALAVAGVGYAAVFWHRLATDHVLTALVGIWLLTFTNILGAREGGLVQIVSTVLKFVPLALLVAIIASFGALNGWILLQGRVPLGGGRGRRLPQGFRAGSRNTTNPGVRPGRVVGAADAGSIRSSQ
jgi:amino acid transporter